MNKVEYAQLAVSEIQHFWELLGLAGEWRAQFSYGTTPTVDGEEPGEAVASFDVNPSYRLASIAFHPRLRAERYKITAAHECLHVLFYQIELAIEQLKEPAKTILRDKMHAIIERLSGALAGDDHEVVCELDSANTPWESDDLSETTTEKSTEEAGS